MILTTRIKKSSINNLINRIVTPQNLYLDSQLTKQRIKRMSIFQISILKRKQKHILQFDNILQIFKEFNLLNNP
jgi:hypothetical protein